LAVKKSKKAAGFDRKRKTTDDGWSNLYSLDKCSKQRADEKERTDVANI